MQHGRMLIVSLLTLVLVSCSAAMDQSSGDGAGGQFPSQIPGQSQNQPLAGLPAAPRPTPQPTVAAPPDLIPNRPPAGSQSQTASQPKSNGLPDFTELYRRAAPSVVYIQVNMQQGVASGSGFIVDPKGYIITNNHVVNGVNTVLVQFFDKSGVQGKVIGVDTDSDLAVIQVPAMPQNVAIATLGDSDRVNVGDWAIAIGNPFGREFVDTMTEGIISAIGRTMPAGETDRGTGSGYNNPGVIQTSAAINPGNSGGPLFNTAGEVIGVNEMIVSPSGTNSGLGFAIPANTVKRELQSLINQGGYAHPWLGIQMQTATNRNQQGLEVPVGVALGGVVQGGPAAKAGLRQGDIITAINGQPINSTDDLLAYVETNARPGQPLTITVYRGGSQQSVTVTVGQRPSNRQQ